MQLSVKLFQMTVLNLSMTGTLKNQLSPKSALMALGSQLVK